MGLLGQQRTKVTPLGGTSGSALQGRGRWRPMGSMPGPPAGGSRWWRCRHNTNVEPRWRHRTAGARACVARAAARDGRSRGVVVACVQIRTDGL